MRNKRSTITICLSVLLSLCLAGCDDDGKSGFVDRTEADAINGELSGRIITTYDFRPYEFDLSTGKARELPLLSTYDYIEDQESNHGGELPGAPYNLFTASNNPANQGYVEVLYDCFRVPTRSCVSVYDADFQVVKRVVSESWFQEPVKLSDSGNLLAMSDKYGQFFETTEIQLMDVATGSVLDSIEMSEEDRGNNLPDHAVTEWGTRDELIFSLPGDERPTVYVTAPGTLDVERTITFPSHYSGVITSLDMHPDGKQLLIGYEGNTDELFEYNGLALVLDLDDLSLRIPAIDQADAEKFPIGENFKSQFVNPIWSPDGTRIMILNMFAIGGTALTPDVIYIDGTVVVNRFIEISDNLIVIPADSDRLVINRDDDTYLDTVQLVVLEDVVDSARRLSPRWRGDSFKDTVFSWIP